MKKDEDHGAPVAILYRSAPTDTLVRLIAARAMALTRTSALLVYLQVKGKGDGGDKSLHHSETSPSRINDPAGFLELLACTTDPFTLYLWYVVMMKSWVGAIIRAKSDGGSS